MAEGGAGSCSCRLAHASSVFPTGDPASRKGVVCRLDGSALPGDRLVPGKRRTRKFTDAASEGIGVG